MKHLITIIASLVVFAFFTGCGSHIVGGQSRHEVGNIDTTGGAESKKTDSYEVLIPTPNGNIIYRSGAASSASTQPSRTENYERSATTQSSVSSDSGLPEVGDADQGEIAGVRFKVPGYSYLKNARWLGAILIAAGLLFVYRAKYIFGGAIVLLGMITILQPLVVIIGIIVLFVGAGIYWFIAEREKRQLETKSQRIVSAMDDALDALPADAKTKAETIMSKKLDRSEKISVSKLKHS